MSGSALKAERWGSSWTLVMVVSGSVIGFSNIWWLPVIAGQNGAGAFWIAYLLGLLLVGVPLIIAELTIGAAGQADPVTAMGNLAVRSARGWVWSGVGWLTCLAGLLLAPLYVVVAGWAAAYMVMSGSGEFLGSDLDMAGEVFAAVFSGQHHVWYWSGAVLLLAMGISACGVNKGVGLSARILVPLGLALLVAIAYFSRHFGNVGATVEFMVTPDWAGLDWSTLIMALTYGIFSLGIGTGVMIAMGNYVPYKQDIPVAALAIVLVEFSASVLAGYVILPMVFNQNIEITGGVALLFVAVPVSFGSVTYGGYLLSLLYVAVLIAAITSLIALLEPSVAALQARSKVSRPVAVLLVGSVIGLLSHLCLVALEYDGQWESGNWFYGLDALSRYLLPAVGLAVAIFVSWVVRSRVVRDEFEEMPGFIFTLWRYSLRFIALPALLIVWFLYVFVN
ncbi:MAG: sodium-dependent transporter [Pseudomonadales bacterium]